MVSAVLLPRKAVTKSVVAANPEMVTRWTAHAHPRFGPQSAVAPGSAANDMPGAET